MVFRFGCSLGVLLGALTRREIPNLNTRCLYVYDFSGFNAPCGKFICFHVKIAFI